MSDSNGVTTLRGRTLLALRELVLKGEFPPGKRLQEIELSRRLRVSRPILRSVLEHLCSEGLLERAPSRGYTARHFTLEDVRDGIRARAALEGLAAGLAAKRIQDRSELDHARELNRELVGVIQSRTPHPPTPEEMSRFGDLNAAFHKSLVSLARSPMLCWALDRVQSAGFSSPAAVVLPAEGDGARRAFEEHEAILEAIEAGDAVRAEDLVREHAGLAIHAIESALEGKSHSGRNVALSLIGRRAAGLSPGARKSPWKQYPSAAGPAPKGAESVVATSARILDAAADLFCEKGFYAATTRELAKRLNIHQASLYHHMSNKENLLHRICRLVIDNFLRDLHASLEAAQEGHRRIDVFIETHLQAMLQNPRRTLAMVTEFRALSRPHFAEISQKYKEYSDVLESELIAAQESGILRTDIPAKFMRLALLNILNWTPRWFHQGGALSCKDLSSIYERVFWDGIASAHSGEICLPQLTLRQRPRDRHRGTLGKFIRGAAELFAKQGYESTSTRGLATLLGMEKATLYYHVESKEDLLYAICKSSIEQLTCDVNQAIAGIQDPMEQLQVLIQSHMASLLRDQTQHATSLAEARALSPERLAEIVSMRKAYQARVRSLIEAGQESGSIRTDISSKYLGLILEGLLDRTVVWYRRTGGLNPSEMATVLCKLITGGARMPA